MMHLKNLHIHIVKKINQPIFHTVHIYIFLISCLKIYWRNLSFSNPLQHIILAL